MQASFRLRLIDLLFERPLVNVKLVRDALDVSFVTANKLVERLTADGLLHEVTGGRRNRVFRYTPYLLLLSDNEEADREAAPVQATEAERWRGDRRGTAPGF